jgi:superfamily II DNA or RNA helicase
VFTYGGDIAWTEHERVFSASFSDALDKSLSARRLRAALDPEAGWIQPLLRDAHKMLLETRAEHPSAGGLIVCADQKHAREMARLITAVSGEKPTVVLSDDSGASKKIKKFADEESLWLVACNMVSEGVDIPRLRVGVYGTTIRTKMYFRQFLGRIVRRQTKPAGLQVSYLYVPADPILHALAEEIEEECRHSLNKKRDSFFDEEGRDAKERKTPNERTWTALQGVNSGVDSVIVQGSQLALFGHHADEVRQVVNREVEVQLEERLTRSETKAKLATDIKNLVGTLHRRSAKPHSAIHTLLNKTQGVRSQTHCTEQQLRERVALLERLILTDGKRSSLSF